MVAVCSPIHGFFTRCLFKGMALTVVSLMVTGCGRDGETGEGSENVGHLTIAVGAIAPLSGDGAAYGTWAQRGVELALEEANAPGQAVRYEVIWEDSRLDPTQAVSAYLKLVDSDKVSIVLGALTSGETTPILTHANTKQVPLLSPTASSDALMDGGDFFFRVCPTNIIQADAAAQFAIGELSANTAFVLFEEIGYGTDLAEAFVREFLALGGVILGQESFREGETDFRPLIQRVRAADADVLYAPSNYAEAGTLLRQMDQLDVEMPVMGGDGSYGDGLLGIAGASAEGTYWTTIAWGTGESEDMARSFQSRYRNAYGEEPHPFAGLYYDAARIAFSVLLPTGQTGSEVRQALLDMEPFHGATGTAEFDENGQVDKTFAVYQVRAQAFVQVAPVTSPGSS